MASDKQRGRPKYRLTVKLDLEWDADLIDWLKAFPRGQRSEIVREALRKAMRSASVADLEAIRTVVAEELFKALAGRQVSPERMGPQQAGEDVEERYGSKLDKMMGNFGQ